MQLMEELVDDLPDLTPHRFLRHPIVKAFLSKTFPSLINPTLADWHVSLANRSHLKTYIKLARDQHYPFRTGWAGMSLFSSSLILCLLRSPGVVNLKAHQDEKLPKESHYIRRVLAIDQAYSAEDDEDDIIPQAVKDDCLRIIICMTPEGSRRLLSSGRYLQSDIAFRRIVGFKSLKWLVWRGTPIPVCYQHVFYSFLIST
jgi:hypothetical protein